MMTGRAWFLGSDLAGVGTAMITHKGRARAPIRPSPARHPRHAEDFADPLDITRGKLVRLPWEYHEYGLDTDGERIVDAVRASMSIPFFFEPVRVRTAAVTAGVADVTAAAGRVTWVDGGMLDNFPVDVFDRTDGAASRWPTIGIKLSARQTSISGGHGTDNIAAEAIACLETVLDNAGRYYITPEKAARTIFVDNAGIKATDFNLTADQRQKLYENGQQAALRWVAELAEQKA